MKTWCAFASVVAAGGLAGCAPAAPPASSSPLNLTVAARYQIIAARVTLTFESHPALIDTVVRLDTQTGHAWLLLSTPSSTPNLMTWQYILDPADMALLVTNLPPPAPNP